MTSVKQYYNLEANLKKLLVLILFFIGSCSEDKGYLEFHQSAFVADLHDDTPGPIFRGLDIGVRNNKGQIDIPRMHEGGMDLIFFSIWLDKKYYLKSDSAYIRANEIIDKIESKISYKNAPDQIRGRSNRYS